MALTCLANNFVRVKEGETTVILFPSSADNEIRFLGTSAWSSVECGYKGNGPITFAPPPIGQTGLIAISVFMKTDKYTNGWYPFLLKIGWLRGSPNIFIRDDDHQFIPMKDHIIQITSNNCLEMYADEQWYTADAQQPRKGAKLLPVSAGNLICKFATGNKSVVPEIKKLAQEQAEKPSLNELTAELKERNDDLGKQIEWQAKIIKDQEKTLDRLSKVNFTKLKEDLEKLTKGLAARRFPWKRKKLLRSLLIFVAMYLKKVGELNPEHERETNGVWARIGDFQSKLEHRAELKMSFKDILSRLKEAVDDLAS